MEREWAFRFFRVLVCFVLIVCLFVFWGGGGGRVYGLIWDCISPLLWILRLIYVLSDDTFPYLADENVIHKANEVTRAVLQDILHDPEITKLAGAFVMHVLHREDVKSAAIQLTQHVLNDPSTLKKINELAKSTLLNLVVHEETRALMLSYIKALILDKSTKDACKVLLAELVKDPDVKGFMAASLGDLVTSSVVKSSAAELGKSVTHEVVNDARIQQETGNFMWRAFKNTFTSGWFG